MENGAEATGIRACTSDEDDLRIAEREREGERERIGDKGLHEVDSKGDLRMRIRDLRMRKKRMRTRTCEAIQDEDRGRGRGQQSIRT